MSFPRARRQKIQKVTATVPLTYNHHQHNIHELDRPTFGLSTNVYKRTDYDRLALSLTSPLPNEQDFAVNVCTLLSNEGKHTLKLQGGAPVPASLPRLLFVALSDVGNVDVFEIDTGTRLGSISVPGARVVSNYWRQ